MKTDKVIYKNKYLYITEATIFFPLAIILGTPLVFYTNLLLGFKIPVWSNFCYFFFCDTSWAIYKKRSVHTAKILFYSCAFCIIAVLITNIDILRCIIALSLYSLYRIFSTEKLGPYVLGFVNIALITGSTILGIVQKDTLESLLYIFFIVVQILIGFFYSLLYMWFYYRVKYKLLGIIR